MSIVWSDRPKGNTDSVVCVQEIRKVFVADARAHLLQMRNRGVRGRLAEGF